MLCLLPSLAFAQNAPMSPQVSSAGSLFTADVYSGAPNVAIPIYTFTSRDISVPIGLNYTGGNGIRVGEEASWVGLGWYLSAGGFIAQQVRGYDDFHTTGYIGAYTKKIPCVDGTKAIPLSGTDLNDCQGHATTMSTSDWNSYDLEPDIFIMVMPSGNVKFFYDKQKNIFSSSSTTCTILMNSTLGNGFTVQTETGLTYTFDVKEQATDPGATDTRFTNQGTTWYLSSIVSSVTNEIVTFSYATNSGNPLLKQAAYSNAVYQYHPGTSSITAYNGINDTYWGQTLSGEECYTCDACTECGFTPGTVSICPDDFCHTIETQYTTATVRQINRNFVYLDNISASFGKVTFNKSARSDMVASPARKLDEIVVAVNDEKNVLTNLMHYTFTYNYFTSDPSTSPSGSYYNYPDGAANAYNAKRLKLISLQQKSADGTSTLPAYSFTYIEGTGQPNLPYKTSLDIDHWGYYNYNSSTHNNALVSANMTGINRASTGVMASAHLLKKVQTPAGGYQEFDYESANGGVRVLRISTYENTNDKLVKKYSYQANTSYSVVPGYTFDMNMAYPYPGATCNAQYGYIVQNGSVTTGIFTVYNSAYPYSFSDLGTVFPQNYTMVTELLGENGELGKTEYYYPAISYSAPNFPFLPLDKNPREGLCTKKSVYKNTGSAFAKVKETAFSYTFYGGATDYTTTTSNGIRLSLVLNNPFVPSANATGYRVKMTQIQSIQTSETVYDQNDVTKYTTTGNTQNFNLFGQVNEVIMNNNPSSGVGTYSKVYFYGDKNASASTAIKFKPVETVGFSFTGDIGNPTKKSYANSFIQYSSNNLPQYVWTSNANVVPSSGTSPTDASYRKNMALAYESSNNNPIRQDNALQENTAGGYANTFSSNASLWGYHNLLPIATVANADATQIAYSGFEDGVLPNTGGWDMGNSGYNSILDKTTASDYVFTGRFSVMLNAAPSGTTVYSPSVNVTPSGQSGKYKMSCWIKVPGTIGANKACIGLYTYKTSAPYAAFPTSGNGVNKYIDYTQHNWQYVEAILDFDALKAAAGGNTLSIRCYVANSDPAVPIYIDDIRIHPLNAKMSTYTYKPGVGKTSEAGADNKPILIEYDVFGRMQYLRDFRGNLLQKNQYFTKY